MYFYWTGLTMVTIGITKGLKSTIIDWKLNLFCWIVTLKSTFEPFLINISYNLAIEDSWISQEMIWAVFPITAASWVWIKVWSWVNSGNWKREGYTTKIGSGTGLTTVSDCGLINKSIRVTLFVCFYTESITC